MREYHSPEPIILSVGEDEEVSIADVARYVAGEWQDCLITLAGSFGPSSSNASWRAKNRHLVTFLNCQSAFYQIDVSFSPMQSLSSLWCFRYLFLSLTQSLPNSVCISPCLWFLPWPNPWSNSFFSVFLLTVLLSYILAPLTFIFIFLLILHSHTTS